MKTDNVKGEYKTFSGFDAPAANFSKLPHKFIDCLPLIDSMAEMKVVLYLLRHTWGFSEYGMPKRITTDEFMNGRKRRDGTRLDKGTGLANNSVITGLEKAAEHGFVLVETDETDKARIEKRYCLNMSDVQILRVDVQDLHSGYAEVAQRSEKETKGKKQKEPPLSAADYEDANRLVAAIIENSSRKDLYWGREQFRDNHLGYADWWYGLTGQPATNNKKQVASCQKAFNDWQNQALIIGNLQTAYDARIAWKKFVTDPNEITKDAAAIQVLPIPKTETKHTYVPPTPEEEALYVPNPNRRNPVKN